MIKERSFVVTPVAANANEFRYRQLADAMPQLVWTADALGLVDYYNVRIHDYDPAVLQGSTGFDWQRFVHPDDLPATVAAWQAAMQRQESYAAEHRLRMADGSWRWHLSRAVLADTANGAAKWYGTATDIHERKAAEEQLRFHASLLDHAYDAVVATDAEFNITAWNRGAEVMYGWQVTEVIGRKAHEVMRSQMTANERAAAVQQMAKTGRFCVEVTTHHRDGTPIAVEGQTVAMVDVTGQLTGYMSINRDIRERKRAEALLRESEAHFRTMADTAPAMLWITDPAGYCTFLSHGWYQFTGQTAATGLGHGWTQAIHPDDQPHALQTFLQANAAHVSFSFDYRLRHVDGNYRWAIDAGHPRFAADGAFLGYIGSVIDITDRKQAEEDLRRSEERYRYLFEAMDEGFCVLEMLFDAQGEPVDYRFLELNPAFERFTGLQHAVGKTALELVPNLEKHWVEIYGRVARTGEPLRFEQGSAAMGRWFDVYAFRVGEPSSQRVALLFKDITARKQAAEQLHLLNATLEQRVQERTAQLERSNRELDQFAYVASHDLKAPLRGIEHLANWIADDAHHLLPVGSRTHLVKLRERVQRMERLLNDLLAYSRVGRRDGTPETVDTTTLISDTVALLAPPAGFTVQTRGEFPALVTLKTPLAIVLRNLIGNAIKHHHQPARGKVEISVQPGEGFVEFCVRDNGPGIEPQYHERIFGVFQTLQPRDDVEGSGMGLALVKKTVEYRGGAVRVESTGSEGTAFYFTWPSIL